MKIKNTLLGLAFISLPVTVVFLINPFSGEKQGKYIPREKHFDNTYYKNTQGIAGALQYYFERRRNIKTGKMELSDMIKAEKEVADFSKTQKKSALGLTWEEMGPDNVGGRTRAILIDKTTPQKIFAGSVAGGLWISYTAGYTWTKYNDNMDNLAISCITQAANGDIYVGTGEGFTGTDGQGTLYTPGIIGRGVFKSTDYGVTFDSLPATVPTNTNSNGAAWAIVNRLAAHPVNANKIYAATNAGLQVTTDGGATWNTAISVTGNYEDVKAGPDGSFLASKGGTAYFLDPDSTVFANITSRLPGISGASRLEFAISPSDPNFMYCCAISGVTGELQNLYQSKDNGSTWNVIVPGGNSGVFNQQGNYDNTIAVFPDDPEHLIVGGVELYAFSGKNNTWDLIALTQSFAPGLYVHADKHTVVFHPNYNGTTVKTFYIGCDGGIFGSFDGGATYQELNNGYNVTQFYAFGMSREGWVAGGTQDNGNPFIDFTGNTSKSEVYNLPSGDGGYMQFSVINPKAFFWESQNGDANRSPEKGTGGSNLFVAVMCTGSVCDDGNEGPWVTPLVIWENFNDLTSTDSVRFVAGQPYSAGETIFIESSNDKFPFKYITPVPLAVNDTVMVQDIVQNKFASCLASGVWMCKDVLNFSKDPEWYKLSSTITNGTCAEFSGNGDILYVGKGFNGQVYRISGLLGIKPGDPSTTTTPTPAVPASIQSTLIFSIGGRFVTGIGVDPNDANNVVVTLGNYGNTNHVYRSITAATTTTTSSFSSIQANLPAMPVYDGLIEMGDKNRIILGTEYGCWATDNGFTAVPGNVIWSNENTGFSRVPTFMIRQQTLPNNKCSGVINSGIIYAGTHGRGIFKCRKYEELPAVAVCDLPISIDETAQVSGLELEVSFYPNPVTGGMGNVVYNLSKSAEVNLSVYGIDGKIYRSRSFGNQPKGFHSVKVETQQLPSGTYFARITAGETSKTIRFVVLE